MNLHKKNSFLREHPFVYLKVIHKFSIHTTGLHQTKITYNFFVTQVKPKALQTWLIYKFTFEDRKFVFIYCFTYWTGSVLNSVFASSYEEKNWFKFNSSVLLFSYKDWWAQKKKKKKWLLKHGSCFVRQKYKQCGTTVWEGERARKLLLLSCLYLWKGSVTSVGNN